MLKAGAVFGMIWNVEDYNKPRDWVASTKWEQKLNDFVWSLDDGLPRFRHLASSPSALMRNQKLINVYRNGKKYLRHNLLEIRSRLSGPRSLTTCRDFHSPLERTR